MFSERQEFLLKLLDTSCPDCPLLPVSLPETVQPIWDYTSRPSRKMGTVKGSKGAIHLCALLKDMGLGVISWMSCIAIIGLFGDHHPKKDFDYESTCLLH